MMLAQCTSSLELGKQSDLLIIDGNPLQQTRDIRCVQLVVKEGQLYEPAHAAVGGFSEVERTYKCVKLL